MFNQKAADKAMAEIRFCAERHWKRMTIDPRIIGNVIMGLAEIVESNIPDDAEFIIAEWDSSRHVFQFIYQHPDWDSVPDGEQIPFLDKPVWRMKDVK